jgi:Flp pilus assembly protein TadD
LISNSQRDGSEAFEQGLNAYRAHSMNNAVGSFETASAAEPENAMFRYYQALAIYELHGAEAANETLRQAVELERAQPIANWGKRMERVQGRNRNWVENARRAAGVAR